jgi:hypothetical protein
MVAAPFSRRLDVDTQPIVEAIVQTLLADTAVTGDKATNGYAGVANRVYPQAAINPDPSGKGQDYPYLIVVCASATVAVDQSTARVDALFDLTVVDRSHTPNNPAGSTANTVAVGEAAWARLLQQPLSVARYTNIAVAPREAPRGTLNIQQGITIRQQRCSVRVQGNWTG